MSDDVNPQTTRLDDGLPELTIHYPTCGHCGEDVEIEDGYAFCATCLVQWSRIDDGATAVPNPNVLDDPTQVCAAKKPQPRNEYEFDGKDVVLDYQPCVLPKGHGGDCRHPYDYTATPTKESTHV